LSLIIFIIFAIIGIYFLFKFEFALSILFFLIAFIIIDVSLIIHITRTKRIIKELEEDINKIKKSRKDYTKKNVDRKFSKIEKNNK
jgi:signal transduction histidine kinase